MNRTELLIPDLSLRPLRGRQRHEGGFGRVLIVADEHGQTYALKSPRIEQDVTRDELIQEALKLVDLPAHPHVISIRGIVRHEDESFIVLPAMSGNLRTYCDGRLSTELMVRMLKEMAAALQHLHTRANVLHLDLKPENVLVTADQHCVLSDFGLASALPSPTRLRDMPELPMSSIVGTIAYMSPEHFTTRKMSNKSDMFAYGVIMFELLTGRHPLNAETIDALARRILLEQPVFSLRERARIPRKLRFLCLACLHKAPAERPSSTDVLDYLGGESAAVAPAADTEASELNRLVTRAQVLAEAGQTREAIAVLEDCLKKNPFSLPALAFTAALEFRLRNYNRATEVALHAASVALWNAEHNAELEPLLMSLSYYYLPQDPEKSITFARWAARLDPSDWQALGNLAEACRVFGQARGHSDLLEEGETAVKSALLLAPNDLKLKVTYGGILLAQKRFPVLIPFVIDLANQYADHDPHVRHLLVRTFIGTGQLAEAEHWLAPMRQYKDLRPMVRQAEQEMEERRKDLKLTGGGPSVT